MLDANARNAVLTVIEGRDFGDKCLLCAGALRWERDDGGFFARNIDAIRDVDRSGMLEIEGQRVFCERLGREKTLGVCGGGHVAIPVICISRLPGLPADTLEQVLEADRLARETAKEILIKVAL